MKILFVDDEPSIRELFQLSLGRDYDMLYAEDGKEALDIALANPLDLIITDVSLPRMSGVEFIRNLRKQNNYTPFIIITGDSNIELAIDTFRMGAIDFFLKPFRIDSIREVIKRFKAIQAENDEPSGEDLICDSETHHYTIIPRLRRLNFFVASLINRIKNLPNVDEEDILALKVTLYELISNAIEHGSAGINYNQKKKYLENNEDYVDLVEKRCMESNRKVHIEVKYSKNQIIIQITDEGDGFDPEAIPDPIKNPTANLYSGRGIFLTKLNIDEIQFNPKGNSVTIIRKLNRNH
jgi:FixJ family two-component response regulator